MKQRTLFGWAGAVTILALALVNDLLLLPLAEKVSQVGFIYAALLLFVRLSSVVHFVGALVCSFKQRKVGSLYPGVLTLTVYLLNSFGVLGIRTP